MPEGVMTEKRQLMGARPPRGTPEYQQYLQDWAAYKQGPEYAQYLKDRQDRKAALREALFPRADPAEFEGKSLEELNALSDQLDAQVRALHSRKQALAAARARLLAEEQADEWGVTAEEYAALKERARSDGRPLHAVLNEARRNKRKAGRATQTVQAGTAGTSITTRGT